MGTVLAEVNVNNHSLLTKEYNGQRVVTLSDIDLVHERENGTAKRTFQYNKHHFIPNEDYYEITRKEFGTTFAPNETIKGNPNLITYLFTESGYLMIAKSFTDDLAWDVQRRLVKSYFRLKEIVEEKKQEVAVQKSSSTPLDREELAAYMIYNGQIIDSMKEGNTTLLTGQLNVMTTMKDMFVDFIKAQTEFNNNVMNTINTLAQTMVTSQNALPVKEEATYVVPKTEISWKSEVFKKVNKYAKDNSSAPQSVLGKIYKRMKNKGINLDSYMNKYREETGLYNNTVINVIAHYDELRTEFEKELGALCNGENQEIPTSISAEAMKTPKAISSLVEQLKPKFGKTNSVVMRRVYKRFEEKTGTSLNIQRSLLAKNLGISNCSKAYAIYSDEKLMNTLMQVIKEMYEEV